MTAAMIILPRVSRFIHVLYIAM